MIPYAPQFVDPAFAPRADIANWESPQMQPDQGQNLLPQRPMRPLGNLGTSMNVPQMPPRQSQLQMPLPENPAQGAQGVGPQPGMGLQDINAQLAHSPGMQYQPQFQNYSGPSQHYQDLIDMLHHNAMALTPRQGNDENSPGFDLQPGHPVTNALGIAALGLQAYAQARLAHSMQTRGMAGRYSRDRTQRAAQMLEDQKFQEEKRAHLEKESLDRLETQAGIAKTLSSIDQESQLGYEQNAAGTEHLGDFYNKRSQLPSQIYHEWQQGEQSRTAADQNTAETATENALRQPKVNHENQMTATSLAEQGAHSTQSAWNTTRNDISKEYARDAPAMADQKLAKETANAKIATAKANAPLKGSSRIPLSEFMDRQAALSLSNKQRSIEKAIYKARAEKDDATVTNLKAEWDATEQNLQKLKKNGGATSASATIPTDSHAAKPPEGATAKVKKNGVHVGWLVNGTPTGFDGKPLPPAGQ